MKFEISIEKRHFYLFAALFLLVAGALVVVGFGGSAPNLVGHSLGELDWSDPIAEDVRISQDLRVDSRIGIGRSPRDSLDIIGNVLVSGDITSSGNVCDSAGNCLGSMPSSALTGTGSLNSIAKFTSASVLSASSIYEQAGNIGIGISSPSQKLDVSGKVKANEFCIANDCVDSWSPGTGAVDWSDIQNIPPGFADGIDNVGGGSGAIDWSNPTVFENEPSTLAMAKEMITGESFKLCVLEKVTIRSIDNDYEGCKVSRLDDGRWKLSFVSPGDFLLPLCSMYCYN